MYFLPLLPRFNKLLYAHTNISALLLHNLGYSEEGFYSLFLAPLPFAVPNNCRQFTGEHITRNKAVRQACPKEGCEAYLHACIIASKRISQHKTWLEVRP